MRSNIKLLFWFAVIQILSFHFGFTTLAEVPKNYLKGKFYTSVKDHFLVATEKMTDSRFKQTVIIMLDNDKNGSRGLVINKPIGKVPLRFLVNTLQDQKNEKRNYTLWRFQYFGVGRLMKNKYIFSILKNTKMKLPKATRIFQ